MPHRRLLGKCVKMGVNNFYFLFFEKVKNYIYSVLKKSRKQESKKAQAQILPKPVTADDSPEHRLGSAPTPYYPGQESPGWLLLADHVHNPYIFFSSLLSLLDLCKTVTLSNISFCLLILVSPRRTNLKGHQTFLQV